MLILNSCGKLASCSTNRRFVKLKLKEIVNKKIFDDRLKYFIGFHTNPSLVLSRFGQADPGPFLSS